MRIIISLLLLATLTTVDILAQGPPIRLDKPIMLGSGQASLRSMVDIVDADAGNYAALLMEADYNIKRNIAVGIEVPWVFSDFYGSDRPGDISIMAKYQFIQKDGMGKSTRISSKIKQMFPTGRDVKTPVVGMGHYKTYVGFVGAYESLGLGIQAEAGYNFVPEDSHLSYGLYKLGVAIPLLEPSFPVNQINVYLESEAMTMGRHEGSAAYAFYLAPGLQYARGKYTFEATWQFPVTQKLLFEYERNWSFRFGGRMLL
ncbi:MAG: hypothetical protein EA362_12715 [Saprospirales bacterium]|nr:MAG: hypothetical protein EA362_12715 [Saprospirales bacterium]